MDIITIIIVFGIILILYVFLSKTYKNEQKQFEYYNKEKTQKKNNETKNISIIKIIIALLIFYIIIKYIFPIIELKILYNLIFD